MAPAYSLTTPEVAILAMAPDKVFPLISRNHRLPSGPVVHFFTTLHDRSGQDGCLVT
jgi:hypothetical protein